MNILGIEVSVANYRSNEMLRMIPGFSLVISDATMKLYMQHTVHLFKRFYQWFLPIYFIIQMYCGTAQQPESQSCCAEYFTNT